jgi:hypothetical protein
MLSCSNCHRHVLVSTLECPHCGSALPGRSGARTTATAALLGLALVGCPAPGDDDTGLTQPAYGVADTGDSGDTGDDTAGDTCISDLYGVPDTGDVDADGDGYTVADGDCDDSNADIHPGATETPGDGVDSNCDGNDDT